MAKSKRKVSAENWPTQHLVLWRTTLDDVPLLLTPDRKVAERYVKTMKLGGDFNDLDSRDAKAAHRVMGLDICSPCNLSIVSFRNGRPYRLKVVREIHDVPSDDPGGYIGEALSSIGEQRKKKRAKKAHP